MPQQMTVSYDELLCQIATMVSYKDLLTQQQLNTIKHRLIEGLDISDDDANFVWFTLTVAQTKNMDVTFENGIAIFKDRE